MSVAQIINAFTSRLTERDLPESIETHVLGTKFTKGDEPVDGTCPLAAALLEPWPTDTHVTMYTSVQQVRCVKSRACHYDLRFDFAMYDLDFDGHRSKPTLEDFARLLQSLYVHDNQPNLVYPTRSGSRLIYLIVPTNDAEWFESHYASLMEHIASPLANSGSPYQVDTGCRDWGRLFRSARVVRDGIEEFDREVRIFHTELLDLDGFRIQPRPKRKVITGNEPFTVHEPRLLRLLQSLAPGNRNQTVYAGLCHAFRKFESTAAEAWVEAFRRRAVSDEPGSERFDDAEFDRVRESAYRTVQQERAAETSDD